MQQMNWETMQSAHCVCGHHEMPGWIPQKSRTSLGREEMGNQDHNRCLTPPLSSTSSGRKICVGNEIVILAFNIAPSLLPSSISGAGRAKLVVVVEAQDWVAAQLEVGLFVQGSQRFPLCKKLLDTLRPPPNALHSQTTQCTNLFSFTTTNPRPKSARSTKNDATPKPQSQQGVN